MLIAIMIWKKKIICESDEKLNDCVILDVDLSSSSFSISQSYWKEEDVFKKEIKILFMRVIFPLQENRKKRRRRTDNVKK
jgi:hypothetical protein